MCGGSSPSGETRVEWNEDMRPRINNQLNASEVLAHNTLNEGFKPYQGQRVADLSRNEQDAIFNASALTSSAPNPWGTQGGARAANDMIRSTLGGSYLGRAGPNGEPVGGNSWAGQTDNPWVSQYKNNTAMNVQNKFQGMDSPYFRQMANQGLEDITNAYKQGTSADTTRMFNLSGAFGGSAHQNAMANNESALAKQMGNYMTGLQNSQYDRSAGLEENRLGRASQAEEGLLSRGNEGWQRAQDRGFQGYENERGRMTGLVGAGQNEQNMGLDRNRALMETGALQRGVNQQNNDFAYQQWIDSQNFPFKTNDWLMGNYGRAMGGNAMNTSLYSAGPSGATMGMAGLLGLLGAFGGS